MATPQSKFLFATQPKAVKGPIPPPAKPIPGKAPPSGDDWHKSHADKFRQNAFKNKK